MNALKLKKIEEIYHAALKTDPQFRNQFLEKCCGGDIELHREVESLLSFEKSSDNLLDNPPESLAAEMIFGKKKDLVGKKIAHYKILSQLGKGGMGVVYLAEDTKLDRKIAVKFLSQAFIHDPDKLNRFRREAKAVSALNHPNILTVYEIGKFGKSHYIATEFIDGKVINKHISTENLPIESVLAIAIQIVSALQTAHDAGITHRDIKPENVMIRKDGIVKVLDFGLAKLTENQSNELNSNTANVVKSITNSGLIMGTPNYMSPEQARGINISYQTDIFSFGIVFYEMLTGNLPFNGDSAMDTIDAILHKEPVSLIELMPKVPRDIEYIVNKTLRKNVSERYQNTKDLLTDLRRVKQRLDYEEAGRNFSADKSNADVEETQIFDSTDLAQIKNDPPNNLSIEKPDLIGRAAETTEISALLCKPETRLLTITGVGGSGKTRLADAISHLALAEFPDGVYYIPLAPIDNYELILPIISQNLGVPEDVDQSLSKTLTEFLHGKKMLIVLDNFEQITKAAPFVSELLTGLMDLKMLVTSRARLNLSFEYEFTLQPLTVPADKKISADECGKFSAVELFVKRATAIKPDFKLTEDNVAFIAEICQHLEGLPLAIELAAARVKLFAPQAILKRLENSLNLLTGGSKDLPERQRTMRGAIAWSYNLLEAEEMTLLNRLSVFRGGLTLEGAEFVGKDEKVSKTESRNFETAASVSTSSLGFASSNLDLISSLVDKSLLLQYEQADGEPHFRMLSVVREFASERLTESLEADEIKRRHAEFYADLSEKGRLEINGANAEVWYKKLEQEHDNIRAALRWTVDNAPEIALQITASNSSFWVRRGFVEQACNWMTEALEKCDEITDPKLRVKILYKMADLYHRRADIVNAKFFGEESLRLSRQIGDKKNICLSLGVLSVISSSTGDFKSARKLGEESLAIAKEINFQVHIGFILNNLGDNARGEEDYAASRKYYEDALENNKGVSNNYSHYYMANLANVTYLLEDYQAARSYALEVLKLNKEFGDKMIVAQALNALAATWLKVEKAEEAPILSGAAAAIYKSINYKPDKVDQKFIDGYIIELRKKIGDEAFESAFEKGFAMPIEETIALARDVESDFQSFRTNDALKKNTAAFSEANKTHPEISRPYNVLPHFRQRAIAASLLVVFLIAGGFAGYHYVTSKDQIKSIAVMPFVNQTGDANNEYLSDGMTDALINKLSQFPQMKVISRSSTFKYKGSSIDTSEIAQTLGVQAIITGRVTQTGDTLQISVEMIDVAENRQIWGDIYYRKVSNVLGIQQEIAHSISEKLNVQLSGNVEKQIVKRATNNSQAYRYYLNGVFYRRRNGADNLIKAIDYQNQAIALDPNFALAYAETALNYSVLIEIGEINPTEGKPKARAAAEKAVSLDDRLPEAYFALGYIDNQELNWSGAEQNFKTAIELNPNFAGAHTLYANYLSQFGRTEEALSEIKKSQELDPLRVGLIGNEGIILYYARRYKEAIIKMNEGLKLEPENVPARVYLGQAFIADKQFDQAISELKIADKGDGDSTKLLIYLGQANALAGKKTEAAAILTQIQLTKKYVSPAALSIFYAALGDNDAAFRSIEKAYAERDINLQNIKVDPGYDPLRDDPRFNEWLSKIGF